MTKGRRLVNENGVCVWCVNKTKGNISLVFENCYELDVVVINICNPYCTETEPGLVKPK